MYTINPGQFKHRIELQEFKKGKDEDNIPISEWVTLLSTKARITNNTSTDVILSDWEESTVIKKFIIRYPRTLDIDIEDTTKYQLIYNNNSYNIHSMSDVKEAGKYLEIIVKVVR